MTRQQKRAEERNANKHPHMVKSKYIINRAQRRVFAKNIEHSPSASICPKCGLLSEFITVAKAKDNTEIQCRICGETVLSGKEVAEVVPPYIYLPYTLKTLKEMIAREANKVEDEEVTITTENEEAV